MNSSEKEKQQKVVTIVIQGIESFAKKITEARDAFHKAMEDLTMHGTETYSQLYLERKTNEVTAEFKAKMETMHKDLVERLESLRTLIQERDRVLDLSNPALTNALALIEAIGADMSEEEAVGINQNFFYDQKGLRALRSSYLAHGVNSPGNLDLLIYNLNDRIDELLGLAEGGTLGHAIMYGFTERFSKLAALEGVTVDAEISNDALWEAMQRGAGLTSF